MSLLGWVKVSIFRRYYVACQIANICKHFTAPEHFSVHRDSKMFAKIGDLTSSMISSEKNLLLPIYFFLSYTHIKESENSAGAVPF